MNYLLDTHTFLWFLKGDPELPPLVRTLIEDPGNSARVSIASFWEITIKHSLGKLPLPTDIFGLETLAIDSGLDIAAITIRAVHEIVRLPQHHKDPFDRIIAATAITTGAVLLGADAIFDDYGVARTW